MDDDDIDIEEHDLLEDPKIRSIFPDLSVLKKEVLEFDEGNTYNKVDFWLKILSSIQNYKDKFYRNIIEYLPQQHNFMHMDDSSNHLNSFEASINNSIVSESSSSMCLGSDNFKLYENCRKNTNNVVLLVKVMLQNIKPYLERSERFCEICLILFPNKVSYKKHKHIHTNIKLKKKHSNDNIDILRKNVCTICDLEFCNYGNLKRHIRKKHFLDNLVMSETSDKMQITETDVMVKINDANENDDDVSFKACFHCDKQFLTQQDLIDHIYEVLKSKISITDHMANNTLQSSKKVNKALSEYFHAETKSRTDKTLVDLNNIYSCPICSYYFSNDKFYMGHVVMRHKLVKKMPIDKVAFNPTCKFCQSKHVDILSYNSHLRKCHKTEMKTKISVNSGHINKNKIKDTKKVLSRTSSSVIGKKYDNVKIMVLKTILFKCKACHIHFLTKKATINHYEHSKITENWECSTCKKLFKEKDANAHSKQHELTNFFSVTEVTGELKCKTLYKCPTCAVHFSEGSYREHLSICESQQPSSSYCKICDILIEQNIKSTHEDDHCINNFIPSDFNIIESENSYAKCFNDGTKQSRPRNDSNLNTVVSFNFGLDLKNNLTNDEEQKKDNKCRSVPKKQIFQLNYCNTCKCNVSKVYRTDIHLEMRCVNFMKLICKYCGLILSNKSMVYHKALHYKYKELKLQDFTFYDIKTKNRMRPQIPSYPKCKSCNVYFISKLEVKRHECNANAYLTCPKCESKFSESAFNLHMPFHNYDLKNKRYCLKTVNKTKPTEMNEINNDPLPIIYTCKNCDLSINTYDEVIEHCHLHTNLNNINEPEPSTTCDICRKRFAISIYSEHQKLHTHLKNEPIAEFCFDVFYFGSSNGKWLKHIFDSLPKTQINKYITNAVHKYVNRIHMEVLQDGPSDLTVYKCDKCKCIVDYQSIFTHVSICSSNTEVSYCNFCSLMFACKITKNTHEKLHMNREISSNSYKVVIFNRKRDENINSKIANIIKSYSVYECRYCHVLVEKDNYKSHTCSLDNCKKCNICGLIINKVHFSLHTLKHKRLKSFNENQIKVVLIGNKPEKQNNIFVNNHLLPTFSGIVCDYTFYECVHCKMCVREFRNSIQHCCLIDAAISECPRCNLVFDEGKLKGHLKLHDTDPDFTKDTIRVQLFDNHNINKTFPEPNKFTTEKGKVAKKDGPGANGCPVSVTLPEKTVKLCKCTCGLHYLEELSLLEHRNKCSGKIKGNQATLNCSKCGLLFSPNVLFKHLLEHHGDKNVKLKFEIVDSG